MGFFKVVAAQDYSVWGNKLRLLLRSGNKSKCGINFRHVTLNTITFSIFVQSSGYLVIYINTYFTG